MEGDAAIVEKARLSLVHLKELNLYLVNSPSFIHANRFFSFHYFTAGKFVYPQKIILQDFLLKTL